MYLDDLITHDEYQRQKRQLEEKLQTLVVPGVDAAQEAVRLLENLPELWEEADLGEQHRILMTMLDAVYVETVEEKCIVAIRPKPAFQALFQIATTKKGSGVYLINEEPPANDEPEASIPCSWWRRGREPVSESRALIASRRLQ